MKLTTTIVIVLLAATSAFAQVQAVYSDSQVVTLQGEASGATFVPTAGNKMEGDFNVFARGSSSTAKVTANVSFVVPAGAAPAGTSATVLKVTGLTAANNRLLQSMHIRRPTPVSADILANVKTEVPVRTDPKNGDTLVTPKAPLESGEYALAFMSEGKIQSKLWAFKVE